MDASARDCLHLFDTSVEGRLSGGWAAGVLLQRARAVYAGPMLTVYAYPVWDTKAARAAKTEAQKERHREALRRQNQKNARKKLEHLVNANFGEGDLIMTHEYAHGKQPGSDEEAARDIRNYIARVKYRRDRMGLPAMRYIYITERTQGQYGVRWHHHIIMSGGLDRDAAERLWTKKHGGISNAKNAQPTSMHLTGFSRYLVMDKRNRTMEQGGKNPQEKAMRRGWNGSKNLVQPKARESDKKISIRKAGRIAEAMGDAETAKAILERCYPGYELVINQGKPELSVKTSRWTVGVYIRATMRRKDRDNGDKDTSGAGGAERKRGAAMPLPLGGAAEREIPGAGHALPHPKRRQAGKGRSDPL